MQQVNKPSENITLPSEGYYYNKDNKLSEGNLDLLLPTTRHEDILTSKTLLNKGTVIDTFLSSLLLDKELNYDELLLADKSGLLIASRILLYGPIYEAEVVCPVCDTKNIVKIDLSKFDTTEFEKAEILDEDNRNEFAFTLPVSGKPIKFKLLTVEDDKAITKELKSNKKIKNHDAGMSTRLSFVITEMEGETNRYKIIKLIEDTLASRDSKALREYITKISPGVDSTIDFNCDECNHEEDMVMPMGTNFFWPSSG